MLGDFQINLLGTEILYHEEDILCCAARVSDFGSVHCAPVAEVRHLLDL